MKVAKNWKKGLIWIVILVSVLIIGVACYFVYFGENGMDGNMSGESIVESNGSGNGESDDVGGNIGNEDIVTIEGSKIVGNIEFSNIQIKKINNSKCEFTADVKNLTMEYLEGSKIKITAISKDSDKVRTFGGFVTELAGLEPNKFTTTVLTDITDVVDVEIEVVDG